MIASGMMPEMTILRMVTPPFGKITSLRLPTKRVYPPVATSVLGALGERAHDGPDAGVVSARL